MAGGLLNIVALGNANIILTGNPTKTFFKVAYSKYTNFGLQKFRLDFDGNRDLRLTEPSVFTFKIKRYADLLMDTYLVANLPNIWSPIWEPSGSLSNTTGYWCPYEFKWIDNIGAQMISEIEVKCGSVTIQRYSGQYLYAMVQRDFSSGKKELFNKMTGNVPELNDPANIPSRMNAAPYLKNTYPSAIYQGTGTTQNFLNSDWFSTNLVETSQTNPAILLGEEPSIRGRTLYIPLNLWFTLDSRCAFPLISLQYTELTIQVTIRPIQEMFQIRDVFNTTSGTIVPNPIPGNSDILYGPYIQPNFNLDQFQMYRFLQTPPAKDLVNTNYPNQMQTWNADVHLLATYCFLSNEEQALFAAQDQIYLVKDIYEYNYLNIMGSTKVKLFNTNRMVSSWMWYMQRNDVLLRNEWSNYTNWDYEGVIPSNYTQDVSGGSGLYITGPYSSANQREIMETMGILFSGDYRENVQPSGVFDYVEKYTRTQGNAKDGLYCYNYCLNTSPYEYQPSGAINMSRFKLIELELTTYLPPIDPSGVNLNIVCNDAGAPISVTSKPAWAMYPYSYDLHIIEEQYNVLSFIGGNCGLMYAR